MSLPVTLVVGLIGGIGAIARFLLDGAVHGRLTRGFPYGTLAVNLLGAFALGVVIGASVGAQAYRLLGAAFLGSFTTFSTWMLESHRLAEAGEVRGGALNLVASLAMGLLVAWLGQRLGAAW
jgi:CrcB protein